VAPKAFLQSTISLNNETKTTFGAPPKATFIATADTPYTITYEATNYKTDHYQIYFDSNLKNCTPTQNCRFEGTYNTECNWDTSNQDWLCAVYLIDQTSYYIYNQPQNAVKRINYMEKS